MPVMLHVSSFDGAAALDALRVLGSIEAPSSPSERWLGAREHLEVLGFDPDDAASRRDWAADGQVALGMARLVHPIGEVAGYEAAAAVLDVRGLSREEVFRTLLGRPLAELAAQAGLAVPPRPTWQFGGWVPAVGAPSFTDRLVAEADLAERQLPGRAPDPTSIDRDRSCTDDVVLGVACLRGLAATVQERSGDSLRIVLR